MTAITKEHLDQLDLAIATGELTVSYRGRTHTYQTTDQMLKARAHIARLLRQQSGAGTAAFAGRSYGLACFDRD